MFGTKGEQLHDSQSSSNSIRAIGIHTNDNLKDRNRLEDIGLEGG
jgi:hypothetical protein